MSSWEGLTALPVFSHTHTLTAADIDHFAAASDDFAPQHMDEEFCQREFGTSRIAHGVLTLGWASAAAAKFCAEHGLEALSYGYDKVRFIAPVVVGDLVTIEYQPQEVVPDRRQLHSQVTATLADGRVCLATRHILHIRKDPA